MRKKKKRKEKPSWKAPKGKEKKKGLARKRERRTAVSRKKRGPLFRKGKGGEVLLRGGATQAGGEGLVLRGEEESELGKLGRGLVPSEKGGGKGKRVRFEKRRNVVEKGRAFLKIS